MLAGLGRKALKGKRNPEKKIRHYDVYTHHMLPPGAEPSRMPLGGPEPDTGTATHMRPPTSVTSPCRPCARACHRRSGRQFWLER